MYYVILPTKIGDNPESWHKYLRRAGPVVIYRKKPEIRDDQQLIVFQFNEIAVQCFGDSSRFDKEKMTLDFSSIPIEQVDFELSDTASDSALCRLSTLSFYHQAWRLAFNYPDQSLSLGKRKYFLLHSTQFKSPPISLSRNPESREALYYNQTSATMNDCYEALCSRKPEKYPNGSLMPNLICVAKSVGKIFARSNIDELKAVIGRPKNRAIVIEGGDGIPLTAVNLKHFVNSGVGVCRHHAMLVCYLLDRMKSDYYLPEGRIIHYRMVLKNGVGHAFVMFQTENRQEIYVIDSIAPTVCSLPTMQTEFKKRYGENIYHDIRDRYLVEIPCEPTLPVDNEDYSDRIYKC